jgi:uncharacterized membrane protein
MPAILASFRLNARAVFYLGLVALLAFLVAGPAFTPSPPRAPAGRCRMKAG